MVYKFYKLVFKILIFFFITLNSLANIIYDKENIVITEFDLSYYKDIYFGKYNEEINNSKAIKNLVIIKKLVIDLEKNNNKFLKKIDKDIIDEIGEENIKSQTVFDIIRYFKTRNEFVINYFKNNFSKSDLENVFRSFDNLNFPISNNNCLTMIKIIDLKDNKEFIDNFFTSIKKQSDIIRISNDNKNYNVCINQLNRNIIDNEILKYIESKTEDDFNKFLYAK